MNLYTEREGIDRDANKIKNSNNCGCVYDSWRQRTKSTKINNQYSSLCDYAMGNHSKELDGKILSFTFILRKNEEGIASHN